MPDRLTMAEIELERLLPGDGFGEHWLAADRRSERWYRYRRIDRPDLPQILEFGFDVEVAAAATPRHWALATPVGHGRGAGGFWTVAPAASAQVLEPRRHTGQEVIHIVAHLVDGLAALHAAGVVHGAVRPAAVQVEDDRVLLADLGLGGLFADHLRRDRRGDSLSCVAPEQIRGERLTPRADVFSIGALLFLLLSGRPAFPASDLTSLQQRQREEDPPPLRHPLGPVIRRCLARDPAGRYPDAAALQVALRTVLARTPAPPARRTAVPLVNVPRKRYSGS